MGKQSLGTVKGLAQLAVGMPGQLDDLASKQQSQDLSQDPAPGATSLTPALSFEAWEGRDRLTSTERTHRSVLSSSLQKSSPYLFLSLSFKFISLF